MYANKLIVLKFGGSVLRSRDDQFIAAQEIYRWFKAGFKVVAIVSALNGETDRLFDLASQMAVEGSPYNVARLVSSGERESAAMLGLVLDECGIPNSVLYEGEINLVTSGDPLDATPESIDVETVQKRLGERQTLVIPGFVGRDHVGRVNLLGRGGADLTAILVANWLNADRCRLIKDVDGLYEFDPNSGNDRVPARYETVSWKKALELDEAIIQHKAVHYAEEHGLNFEVAASLEEQCTKVGRYEVEIEDTNCRMKSRSDDNSGAGTSCISNELDRRLKVGLLGFGTVGRGVYKQLQRLKNKFDLIKVAVHDLNKHMHMTVERNLFTDDWRQVVDSDCDVVVELIGGIESAKNAVLAALKSGKPVVTANKSLMARCHKEVTAACGSEIKCYYSAAVGGSTPMLEATNWVRNSGQEIAQIQGILNGTSNYVLDLVANGVDFHKAVKQAQKKGLAEADPRGDLCGNDAAEKLVLLCRQVPLKVSIEAIETMAITPGLFLESPGQIFRQIATTKVGRVPGGRVEVQDVSMDSDFANIERQQNYLKIQTSEGGEFKVLGSGAGRWPTTMAVLSDLIAIQTKWGNY